MGKWKNAPVVYVILQVRFSPVLALRDYIPEIQEHFRRNGFPAFEARFNFQLAFSATPPGAIPPADPEAAPPPPAIPVNRSLAYVFSNRDRSQSFMLEHHGLTLQVTDYQDFGWFLDLFLKNQEHVNTVISPDSSERIGLRYIDAVLPKQGSRVNEYLIPTVLGLSEQLIEGAFQHSFSETVFLNGSTSTVSRIVVRNGQIAFPPDMGALPVVINPRFTEYRGSHALVDTDSFQAVHCPMELQNLRATLQHLHDSVESAFNVVTTNFARADWK